MNNPGFWSLLLSLLAYFTFYSKFREKILFYLLYPTGSRPQKIVLPEGFLHFTPTWLTRALPRPILNSGLQGGGHPWRIPSRSSNVTPTTSLPEVSILPQNPAARRFFGGSGGVFRKLTRFTTLPEPAGKSRRHQVSKTVEHLWEPAARKNEGNLSLGNFARKKRREKPENFAWEEKLGGGEFPLSDGRKDPEIGVPDGGR